MQMLFKDRGIDSKFVDLSEVITSKVPCVIDQSFYERLAETVAREVEGCGPQVPVITGYFGTIPGGLLNKIGRGYTDLCAAVRDPNSLKQQGLLLTQPDRSWSPWA